MLKLIKLKDDKNNIFIPDSLYQKIDVGKYMFCCNDTFNLYLFNKELRRSNNIPNNFKDLVLSDIVII